jgi:ribosome-associated toxin RatA of RatAB toxin-antitoxin module
MAGVQSVKILSSSGDTVTARFTQTLMGRKAVQILESHIKPRALVQRQIKGRFRKWDTTWRFLDAPDGSGTTIALEVDYDVGMFGIFISGMVRSVVDQGVRTTAKELGKIFASEPHVSADDVEAEILLQVFQRGRQLEVHVGDRVFTVDPKV